MLGGGEIKNPVMYVDEPVKQVTRKVTFTTHNPTDGGELDTTVQGTGEELGKTVQRHETNDKNVSGQLGNA